MVRRARSTSSYPPNGSYLDGIMILTVGPNANLTSYVGVGLTCHRPTNEQTVFVDNNYKDSSTGGCSTPDNQASTNTSNVF